MRRRSRPRQRWLSGRPRRAAPAARSAGTSRSAAAADAAAAAAAATGPGSRRRCAGRWSRCRQRRSWGWGRGRTRRPRSPESCSRRRGPSCTSARSNLRAGGTKADVHKNETKANESIVSEILLLHVQAVWVNEIKAKPMQKLKRRRFSENAGLPPRTRRVK